MAPLSTHSLIHSQTHHHIPHCTHVNNYTFLHLLLSNYSLHLSLIDYGCSKNSRKLKYFLLSLKWSFKIITTSFNICLFYRKFVTVFYNIILHIISIESVWKSARDSSTRALLSHFRTSYIPYFLNDHKIYIKKKFTWVLLLHF